MSNHNRIDEIFPQILLAKSRRSENSKEIYWRHEDIPDVIDALERSRKIIYGLEYFSKELERLRVLGYADFSDQLKILGDDADSRIHDSCRLARQYVSAQKSEKNDFFTVTWDDE